MNIDDVLVHKQFHFSCSMNTARVYLYDKVNGNYGQCRELFVHVLVFFYFKQFEKTKKTFYIFQNSEPLHVNFLPADIQMDNLSELPEVLLHPENFKLVKRFVREWNRYRNELL